MGSIERDAHGVPVRMRGITHDITDRRKAELALAERDAQLHLAGKAARVGSFAVDISTGTVHNSPGYAAIHGLAEGTEEFPREEWRARVHPDDLQRLDALRSQAFAERRREHNTEYRIVGPDGKARWIESRSLVSYDGDGRPIRVVGIHIDITERKRAQTALEESEARYRALYDNNPSMYFTIDPSGTLLSVNEFGARRLGYSPAELVGQSVLKVVHEDDRERALRHLAKCAENVETITTTELRKIHRDGSIIWVRELARAVRESAEQRTVLLLVCEEITERKRAEEQQSLLVAELDHRVKNVLASVAVVAKRTSERRGSTLDFIEALDRRLQSMAEAHALLSRNRWQGVSLADLVGQELAPFATAENTVVEGPMSCSPPLRRRQSPRSCMSLRQMLPSTVPSRHHRAGCRCGGDGDRMDTRQPRFGSNGMSRVALWPLFRLSLATAPPLSAILFHMSSAERSSSSLRPMACTASLAFLVSRAQAMSPTPPQNSPTLEASHGHETTGRPLRERLEAARDRRMFTEHNTHPLSGELTYRGRTS